MNSCGSCEQDWITGEPCGMSTQWLSILPRELQLVHNLLTSLNSRLTLQSELYIFPVWSLHAMIHFIAHYKTAKRLKNSLVLTLQLNLILQLVNFNIATQSHSATLHWHLLCNFCYMYLDSCLYEYQIYFFRIDLVLTCQELLESQPIKKLFDVLHIYH